MLLLHHTFTENNNCCWSNSSFQNIVKWRFTLRKQGSCSSNTVTVFWKNCTARRICLLVQHSSLLPLFLAWGELVQSLWDPVHSWAFIISYALSASLEYNPTCTQMHWIHKQFFSAGTLAWNLSFLPDVHTEAVQAALAKHKERKMAVPMPSKRRSLVVQTSMDAYTPPGRHLCLCILQKIFKRFFVLLWTNGLMDSNRNDIWNTLNITLRYLWREEGGKSTGAVSMTALPLVVPHLALIALISWGPNYGKVVI